ncbi:MAG: MogA/MoaB family molybdenum cofactor biosynthesis protein [Planctomycetota bacterium]|jgi:molybdenum cofactor synthesis domain-containing protein
MQIRAAILVTSDRISQGIEQDRSGALAAELLAGAAEVAELKVVPDDVDRIAQALRQWCAEGLDLILTIGGTGLGPRDVTPEATQSVLEREAPGINAALLARGLSSTPKAMLSRAVAGTCGSTLIINLPGSTSAVRESVPYLLQVLPHAMETLHGQPEAYGE